MITTTATVVWQDHIEDIVHNGYYTSPRGKATLEIPHRRIVMNMRYPIVLTKTRKLSYQFMTAEAYWILSGDNRVAGIAPYCAHIARFSDDGDVFFGAYGPKIAEQLPYILRKLREDPDTRQAGLNIWRENPPNSKDVPCTISMFFHIRDEQLNAHVFMRSSDAWLGVPYDLFNFSMIAHFVCAQMHFNYNTRLEPGTLYLTMASAHIYTTNLEKITECINEPLTENRPTPESMFVNPMICLRKLKILRESKIGSSERWWEK